jgi:hypothetical protein
MYSKVPSTRRPSASWRATTEWPPPRVRSPPALARISERFLIVRRSMARWNLAKLSNGNGMHCRTQSG